MNSKVSQYIVGQLAASGFAVIDHAIARELTHDSIWASAYNALTDFTQGRTKIREFLGTLGMSMLEVKFAARDHWVLVGARSADRLAERIHWVTGLTVEGLRPFSPVPPAAVQRGAAVEDEPPAHQCTARAEWFEKHGIPDPQKAPKQPPWRIYG